VTIQAPRGTLDVLPADQAGRLAVLDSARSTADDYGYGLVVTPTFEDTELFARSLGEASRLAVAEAQDGDLVRPGLALLAPAGYHLTFSRRPDGAVAARLGLHPLDTPHRPAVDVLFRSAAEVYGERVLAVVLTGMGADGTVGAGWVKASGGRVLTQAEETCVVYGMPRQAITIPVMTHGIMSAWNASP